MSKQSEADRERIPSYEESIATSPQPPLSPTFSRKISHRQNIQERTRQERIRRIAALITNHLEQAISNNLEEGIDKFALLLVPSDSFPTAANITVSSVTSPSLSLPTTLVLLQQGKAAEREDDYKSSFLTQSTLIHHLTHTLHQSFINPESLYSIPSYRQQTSTQPSQSSTTQPLPQRPPPKSWLSRNLQRLSIPGPEHDPTGSTGSWNLGWKSDIDTASTQASASSEELSIFAKLQDVTFRTESEMGLLESRNVKCVWIEMDVKS